MSKKDSLDRVFPEGEHRVVAEVLRKGEIGSLVTEHSNELGVVLEQLREWKRRPLFVAERLNDIGLIQTVEEVIFTICCAVNVPAALIVAETANKTVWSFDDARFWYPAVMAWSLSLVGAAGMAISHFSLGQDSSELVNKKNEPASLLNLLQQSAEEGGVSHYTNIYPVLKKIGAKAAQETRIQKKIMI